jgi:hypothetical protein
MNNQVSRDVKTRALITIQKTVHFITERQYETLLELSPDDILKLEDGIVRFMSVAEVTTIDEYYRAHPDKRPTYENYAEPPRVEAITPWNKKRHLRALNSMRDGFARHFEGRKMSAGQLAIFEKMTEAIKKTEALPETSTFRQPSPSKF